MWGGIKRFEHFQRGLYFSDNCVFDLWVDFVSSASPSFAGLNMFLVVMVTFFCMPRFIYLCRTSFILVFNQRTVMLTHAREQTCALKTFSEPGIVGQQAYTRRNDYFDQFSGAQVILVRVFFSFFHFSLHSLLSFCNSNVTLTLLEGNLTLRVGFWQVLCMFNFKNDNTKQNLSARNNQDLKPILGKILLDKKTLFLSTYQRQNFYIEDFAYMLLICEATSVPSNVGFKISAQVRHSSVTSNTLWASVNFLGQITIQSYFVFVSTVELRTLYMYPGTSLYEHILWVHLEKNRTYARTFPVQRKEINVVKVRFTMRYSSRKLSNDKVITTACNFWRQIACSFQVYGRTNHFCAKSTRKTLFWISRFFFTWPTLTSQAVFADNFSDRSTKIRAKK